MTSNFILLPNNRILRGNLEVLLKIDKNNLRLIIMILPSLISWLSTTLSVWTVLYFVYFVFSDFLL